MIKSKTYFDIPQAIRTEAANKVREQLRTSLVNPAYTEDQRKEVLKAIERLTQWEAGTLQIAGVTPPPAPAKKLTAKDKIRAAFQPK